MNLPPVDVFRKPLVEPLGHVVLQAAYLESELISFIATLMPLGPETSVEKVAHRLRNWDADFINKAISGAILDRALVHDLRDYLKRVGDARERRHRMIHDAMEIGLDETPDGIFQPIFLQEGYQRASKHHSLPTRVSITAENVAALARSLYDLRNELESFLARWREVGAP